MTTKAAAVTRTVRPLLSMDSVRLEFQPEAVRAIAREAHRRKTGARALRGIVEDLMLDLMYDLPSQTSVKEFTVTRAMVEEHTGGKVLPLPGTEQQKTA